MLLPDCMDVGFVTATYPKGQSIDVLMSDGSRLSNVQVMVSTGSSVTGEIDLPDPGLPTDNTRWDFNTQPTRYLRAVVAFCRGGAPICVGFLLPQVTQVTFDQKNRRIMRHASDVYTTIDDSGNTELYHPSGAYVRIGTNPAHEDLTGQDVDGLWKIARNTTQQVHIRIAGLGGTTLDIGPNGNVTVSVPAGTVGLTCPAGVSITAPVEITGDVTITGDVGITGGLGVTVSGGGSVSFVGNISLNGQLIASGDVTAGTISLMGHPHANGSYNVSGTPVTGLSGLPT